MTPFFFAFLPFFKDLETELIQLIGDGKLQARIDSEKKVCKYKKNRDLYACVCVCVIEQERKRKEREKKKKNEAQPPTLRFNEEFTHVVEEHMNGAFRVERREGSESE